LKVMSNPASQSATPAAGLTATGGLSSSRTRPLPGNGGVTTEEAAEQALQDVAKGGSSVDTALGRLVIDYGLATAEEVQHVQDILKAGSGGVGAPEDASGQSLARALVDQEFVTKRQIARLKQILDAERSGQKIPGYKVLGKLGAGAMATVYKARQLNLDRLVAIKVLPRKFSANSQFIERFYAEGRAAAQLNHPNIVQAYDVGKAGEYHYFVMEFVDGRTVYDDIVKHKRYPEAEAIEIAIQVAEALEHAHTRGLIHRDVKPKNIMMGIEGVVKLADMGLARAISDKEAAEAESGKAFGTPYYISPEQIRGETNVGPPADIYSLGATLYHMVTGSVPFDGKNPSSVMHKHLKAAPIPPDQVNPKLSAGISEVIEMMMAKRAGDRYQTSRDLLEDLKAVQSGNLPPLAHRDLGADALVSLASGEAAQAPQIVEDTSGSGRLDIRTPLLAALGVALAISVIVNLLLWLG
jgi:tRNA A-37 threonylcarbamoyl transferase component Bud32